MTLFEYLSVAFSIVLSLAGIRFLRGVAVSFRPGRMSIVHTSWLAFSLLNTAMVWWNFWSYRDIRWSFFSFLLVLAVPGTIYLMAVTLVPEGANRIHSWEEHFFEARTRFFAALALFFVLIALIAKVLLGLSLWHPIRAAQALALALALTGAFSSHRGIHRALAATFLLLQLLVAGLFFDRPGSMAP